MYSGKCSSEIFLFNQCLNLYGNISLNTLLEKVKGNRIYKCPKCGGEGTYEELEELDSNDGKMGYWHTKTCNICDGYGYTEVMKQPIMKQNGWK